MEELFIKKYWDENGVMFYFQFQNGKAVTQIEIKEGKKIILSTCSPIKGDSFLYDQSLEELELQESDFISKEDFIKILNGKK